MSYDSSSSLGQAARVDRPMSRVDALVQQTKLLTDRVRNNTERVIRHTQTLGFFNPPPANAATSAPTPVITTLEDALRDLDRALDEHAAALNLFD